MSKVRKENAFMASLLADLDASIFSEEPTPPSTQRTPPAARHNKRNLIDVKKKSSSVTSPPTLRHVKLSLSPSPRKRATKRVRCDEEFFTSSQAKRAEEIQAATDILLEQGDDWMKDLLSPSPKRKKPLISSRPTSSPILDKGKTKAASWQLTHKADESSQRYTRCVIKRVIEGYHIPKRYEAESSSKYCTDGVKHSTVSNAMRRSQKVIFVAKLLKVDLELSSERFSSQQREGQRCRVFLRDEWLHTPVQEGDIVHLIGEWQEEEDDLSSIQSEEEENDLDKALWDEFSDIPASTASDSKSAMIPTMTLASSGHSLGIRQSGCSETFLDNLLILHPDVLLSATAISTVVRCARKAYLQNKVKVSGPASEDAPSESLVLGKMLHEVLQSCLTGRHKELSSSLKMEGIIRPFNPFPTVWKGPEPTNFSSDFVQQQIEAQLRCSTEDILCAGLDSNQARDKLWEAAAPFAEFASRYLAASEDGKPRKEAEATDAKALTSPPLIRIKQVLDVEEDIWSPMFGLKGFVDVSVEVEIVHRDPSFNNGKGRTMIMPLELKTGRSIDRVQHQAQTMLYTLMMSDRYHQKVDRGLLYYSKIGTMHLVHSVRNEVRGLMTARNELASYLFRRSDSEHAMRKLPPTITNDSHCERCYVSDDCMLFKRSVEGGHFELGDNSLLSLYDAKVGHLTQTHADFFKYWEQLLSLEEDDLVRFRRQLWTMTAAARESTGRCLEDMVLLDGDMLPISQKENAKSANGMNDRIVYRFRKSNQESLALLASNFAIGDPISVSIEPDLFSVAQGHLLDLTFDTITVAIDRDLRSLVRRFRGSPPRYRIDKEEFANGMARVRHNLAKLFYASPHGDSIRRALIVDLREPLFHETEALPSDLSKTTNEDQRAAIQKVLAAKDYALIVGMPGTGKTTTIVELIKQLTGRGNSVLLTSYTHSAVDTICRKLGKEDGVELLRLGSTDRVHTDVQAYMLKTASSVEELEDQLMRPNVVATTCLSIGHALFAKRKFDYCIIDEASQITLPTCLGPLRYADKFVLVGDPQQLPPLVKNSSAKAGGLDVSLFDLLQKTHPQAVVQLRVQYRMTEDIMWLSNELTYGGQLRCGSDGVRSSCLKLSLLPEARLRWQCDTLHHKDPCWIEKVLSEHTKALFINTDEVPGRERRVGETLLENDVEADVVVQLSTALVSAGVPLQEIAVITPYRQQLRAIVKRLGLWSAEDKIEVLTADKSQGRDKDVILISFVRSNESSNEVGEDDASIGQLLNDIKRINVALTRARKKLVIIGSRSTLSRSPLLRRLWNLMDSRGWTMSLSSAQLHLHQSRLEALLAEYEVIRSPSPSPGKGKCKSKNRVQNAILQGRPILQDVINESL